MRFEIFVSGPPRPAACAAARVPSRRRGASLKFLSPPRFRGNRRRSLRSLGHASRAAALSDHRWLARPSHRGFPPFHFHFFFAPNSDTIGRARTLMNRRNEVADRVPLEVAIVHSSKCESAGGRDAKVRSRQLSRCFSIFFCLFPFRCLMKCPCPVSTLCLSTVLMFVCFRSGLVRWFDPVGRDVDLVPQSLADLET